jgi:hypothetical protein
MSDMELPHAEQDPVETAASLYLDREKLRLFVECMLLAGADNQTLSKQVAGLTVDEAEAFHACFFEVRPYLATPSWVVETVMGGEMLQPLSRRDSPALYHRIAYICGPELFQTMWSGRCPPEQQGKLAEYVLGYMRMQTAMLMMTFGNKGDQDIELIKIAVDGVQETIKSTPSLNQEESARQAVLGFLEQFPIGVADPTKPENLTLPAREPRVRELVRT